MTPQWMAQRYSNSVACHLHIISDVVLLPIRLRWCVVAMLGSIQSSTVMSRIQFHPRIGILMSLYPTVLQQMHDEDLLTWFKIMRLKICNLSYSLSLTREGSSISTLCILCWNDRMSILGEWLIPSIVPVSNSRCSNLRTVLCGGHKSQVFTFDDVMDTTYSARSPVNNLSGMLKWIRESKSFSVHYVRNFYRVFCL